MPESTATYTQQYTVYRHDGDHHGNVKPGALLRYGQQIATIHAEAVGLNDAVYAATHTAFVLAKQALHIDRTPGWTKRSPQLPSRSAANVQSISVSQLFMTKPANRWLYWTAAGC